MAFTLLLLSVPTFARQRCVIQVTPDGTNMNIIQLCTTDRHGKMRLSIALPIPYSVQGPVGRPLPIDPAKVKLKKKGCTARVTPGLELSVDNASKQCRIQASYSFAHAHKDYFLLFKNISGEPIQVQVVTRRTPMYYPQVRPLLPYTFSEEEDTSGAWQYMSITRPLAPGASLVILAARQPDRGFVGGWAWLWGAMAASGMFILIGWRRSRA